MNIIVHGVENVHPVQQDTDNADNGEEENLQR